MEILLKSDSTIEASPKTIEVADIDFDDQFPDVIQLEGVDKRGLQTRVTVTVKVTRVGELEIVRTGKQKQDIYISDNTASSRITIWEDHVGMFTEGQSYKLENFVVREWGSSRYLAMYSDSNVVSVADIPCVQAETPAEEKVLLTNAQIVAVVQLAKSHACMRCGA